jgi:hypothetical protein
LPKRQPRRLARKQNLAPRPRQNNPPGKSLLIFGTHVKPGNQKYSAFAVEQIIGLTTSVSPDERGGSRSSRTRGGMRWTRGLRATSASDRGRRSRVVLAPRRWRQVDGKQNFPLAMVATKPGHQGEHGVSRKPSRRESRIASAGPVCSCAHSTISAHGTAGAARTRLSLRPLLNRARARLKQAPGESRRGNANARLDAV